MDIITAIPETVRGWVFEWAVLPVLYGLGLMSYAELAHDALDEVILGLLQVLAAFAILRPLEGWRPVERWADRRLVRVDILYTLVERLGLLGMLFFFTLQPLVDRLDGVLRGAGWMPPNLEDLLPAGAGGGVAGFLVYLVVLDLGAYAYHRVQHRFASWWALHSVHHSQTQLSFWADDRNHVVDSLLRELWLAGLALAIGVPGNQFVTITLLSRLVENLSHVNARVHFGWLGERLLVSPRYHRIHHGAGVGHDGPARGCNFATLFPLWDIAFGTANFAAVYPATGIRDPEPVDYGRGWLSQQTRGLARLAAVWRPSRTGHA